MIKNYFHGGRVSLKDKIFSFDYQLISLVLLLGIISFFAMYSTEGGNFDYYTQSHIYRFCVFFFISACGSSKGENTELQESYNIAVELKDEKKIMESNKLFHEIIESPYVTDDLKIKSIFMISQIFYDLQNYTLSIEYFKKILDADKLNDLRKKSLFMIGYTYNNHLDMYTDAITYYNQFIAEYKDDELIPSVKFELQQINEILDNIETVKE